MKRTTLLLLSLLIIASIFITSPAKAQNEPCQGAADPTTGGCPTNGGGTNMPVNGGIVYLLITGALVGIAAIKRQEMRTAKA